MAVEPREVVSDITRRAHDPREADAPTLLQRPPGPKEPLPSVQHGDELAAVHRAWAEAHAAKDEAATPEGSGTTRGGLEALKARLKAQIASAAAGALPDHDADRQVIGDLIRATDALARRVDELGGRLVALEELVEEVVVVVSEDLAKVRALLSGGRPGVEKPGRRRNRAADD